MRVVDAPCLPYQTCSHGCTLWYHLMLARGREVRRGDKMNPPWHSVVVIRREMGAMRGVVLAGPGPELQVAGDRTQIGSVTVPGGRPELGWRGGVLLRAVAEGKRVGG